MVPFEMKRLITFDAFKRKVKKWKPENCSCRPCKPYIQSLGFVNAYQANVPFFDPLKTLENIKFF